MLYSIKKVVIILSLSLLAVSVFGQENDGLKKSLSTITAASEQLQVEKLYLQFDKEHYTEADTIRFKAYLMSNALTPSTKSGILYIAMSNDDNRVVKQISIPMISGIGWGNIALDGIRTGNYTFRAFTNWMLNFDEDHLFKKIIYIAPLNAETMFIKAAYKVENTGSRDKVTAGLQLTGLNGQPIRIKDIWLRLGTDYTWLYNNKLNTGMDGRMNFNFKLSDKTATKNLYIDLQQIGKGVDTKHFLAPVNLNRPENIDLQFMPEGGNMVAGISQKIGFKAINEDGTGAIINGKIYDNNQQEITEFRSTHKGMGSFEFTPQPGESYTARVILPDNTAISYKLPSVKSTGTTLKVTAKGKDSLEITLSVTPNLINSHQSYYLVCQTGGTIYYAAGINFKRSAIKIAVTKDMFPAGIAHFTLFDSNNQPLNERIYYISHKEVLKASLTTDKTNYTIRDSITVTVNVKDKDDKPVEGSFSLAVTDDSQANTDSTKNIVSHFLLTSDLKGHVEDPAWYFDPDSYREETSERATALDNLLLTQGWVDYDWKSVFTPTVVPPIHMAEPDFAIKGRLTNVFNNALKKQTITLLQKNPVVIMQTLTDDNGVFVFKDKNLLPTDSTYYLLQVVHKNGNNKDFNVGLELDVPATPKFPRSKEQVIPWYFNTDTTLLNNTITKIAQDKAESDFLGYGHILKPVIINEAKIIPDSFNLNGPGGSDRSMNEADMNLEKSRTLLELLLHKYKDFQVFNKNEHYLYLLGRKPVSFFIDGISTTWSQGALDVLLDWYTASDIKGIEIMTSDKLTYEYDMAMSHPPLGGIVYMEITTYSGVGPFFRHKAGRYVYRPIALTYPKAFYSPKYDAKDVNIGIGTDLRSTIYWRAGIVTDKEGKATVTFFSADKPANYTLTLEGTDLNGGFGYSRQKVKIIPKTTAAK